MFKLAGLIDGKEDRATVMFVSKVFIAGLRAQKLSQEVNK